MRFFLCVLAGLGMLACSHPENKYSMNEPLKSFLNNDLKNISINYTTIEVANHKTFEGLQKEFAPEGQELGSVSGSVQTGWKESWRVIAYMEGDPFFMDMADNKIYTSLQGEGTWEPEFICSSVQGFERILRKLKELSVNRSNPRDFESHPLSEQEMNDFVQTIKENGGESDFWTMLIEGN